MWWYARALDPVALQEQQVERERHGVRRARSRSMARSDIATGDMPGGAARHFCVQSRRRTPESAHVERDAREPGDAVGHQHVSRSRTERRARRAGARRRGCLGVDDGHDAARPALVERRRGSRRWRRTRPVGVDRDHLRAVPPGDRRSAVRRSRTGRRSLSSGSSRFAIPVSIRGAGAVEREHEASGVRYTRRSSSRRRQISCIVGRGGRASAGHRFDTAGSTLVGSGPQSSRSGGRSWRRGSHQDRVAYSRQECKPRVFSDT